MLWIFEDKLKGLYGEYIKTLEVCAAGIVYACCRSFRVRQIALRNNLEHYKERVVSFVFQLLAEAPEQESTLLALLVNKMVGNALFGRPAAQSIDTVG